MLVRRGKPLNKLDCSLEIFHGRPVGKRAFARGAGLFAAVLTAFFFPVRAEANQIAVFISPSPATVAEVNTTFGWSFSLSAPVTVTDLGIAVAAIGGLVQDHPVTIWTSSGTQMAQTTVLASSPLGPAGFVWQSLSAPVSLPAGDYVIGAYYTTDVDPAIVQVPNINPAAAVTYTGSRSASGNVFPVANSDPFLSNGVFGPNFMFVSVGQGVPEPVSTAALMAIGFLALFVIGRPSQTFRPTTRS